MIVSLVISAICGIVIGMLSGLLGIGGGTLIVPYLRLGMGLAAIEATATSLFTIIPTSISGAIAHVRGKTCVVHIGIAAGIGGAVTSPIGVYLASLSPSILIMVVAGCVIAYSASSMLYKVYRSSHTQTHSRNVSEVDDSVSKASPEQIIEPALIGIFAGVASGYVGVGGVFLMVPLFDSLLKLNVKEASGTSLLAVCILSVPGVITQGMLGNINYLAGIALAAGTIPGAALGSMLIRHVPEKSLRLIFITFLFVVAILLVLNEIAL